MTDFDELQKEQEKWLKYMRWCLYVTIICGILQIVLLLLKLGII